MPAQGIFQAAYGLINTYLEFLMASSLIYVTAHLSGLGKGFQITQELNKFFRLGLLGFIPVATFILIFKSPLLNIIYTSKFAPAAKLMPVFVIGNFFRVISWMLGLSFLPFLKLRAFLFFQIFCHLIYIILSFFLLPVFSLQGVVISYSISYAILSAAFYFYLKARLNFKLLSQNRVLFLNSLIFISFIGLLTFLRVKAAC